MEMLIQGDCLAIPNRPEDLGAGAKEDYEHEGLLFGEELDPSEAMHILRCTISSRTAHVELVQEMPKLAQNLDGTYRDTAYSGPYIPRGKAMVYVRISANLVRQSEFFTDFCSYMMPLQETDFE